MLALDEIKSHALKRDKNFSIFDAEPMTVKNLDSQV